ncbi:helix-turn-helix transcriptional regulator [Lacrimispora sp.]|uniref:helix-turn-helix domain-containing protein n=1 Tax=Lacrimispora sp. TaxID=2719234 RepID=UPI0032E4D9F2
MADIGKRIREKREANGITQEELATKLGYKNKSTIAKIENGTNDIVQSKVVEFANALNTSASYLMGWEEKTSNAKQSQINQSDYELLRKYHLIDDKGRHTVDTVLEMEYNRCIVTSDSNVTNLKPGEDKSHIIPVAAHERTDIEVTEEMKQYDDAFFDE